MKTIWNVSPHALALDIAKPAIQPTDSTNVEDDVAAALVAGPDWSYTNPRPQRPTVTKLVVLTSNPPAEPEWPEAA
jgi:hypothetical protein